MSILLMKKLITKIVALPSSFFFNFTNLRKPNASQISTNPYPIHGLPNLYRICKLFRCSHHHRSNPNFHLKCSLFPNSHTSELLQSFYFALNGKPLRDDAPIPSSQITHFSVLVLVLRSRLRGGGGDGGATGAESRDCYLNMYVVKKPDKVDPNEQRLSKWLNCDLSNEPLREPCVIDKLGNIFNKEAPVEALLGKKLPKEFGHIKGLEDMIKIQLSVIPDVDDLSTGTRFQCPISGLEFNRKYKFLALKNCGHVLSPNSQGFERENGRGEGKIEGEEGKEGE